MKNFYYAALIFTGIFTTFTVTAQNNNVGIGTTTPDASAVLDLQSTTQGLLPPRMTTTERNAISSQATGLVVYDTDVNALYLYDGTSWAALSTGTSTPVYGEANLASTYSITAGSWTFQDIGVSVTLPSAGTYRVFYSMRSENNLPGGVAGRLYNVGTSLAVPNTEVMIQYSSYNVQVTAGTEAFITVTGATTIKLQAAALQAGLRVKTDFAGRTRMTYQKID